MTYYGILYTLWKFYINREQETALKQDATQGLSGVGVHPPKYASRNLYICHTFVIRLPCAKNHAGTLMRGYAAFPCFPMFLFLLLCFLLFFFPSFPSHLYIRTDIRTYVHTHRHTYGMYVCNRKVRYEYGAGAWRSRLEILALWLVGLLIGRLGGWEVFVLFCCALLCFP